LVTPDLRQMRYVVEVAKERGFSRAALTLHVAQQAVSQQVKAVEAALGVRLFERTNRGVELTAAGEAFVQEARRTLDAADRVGRRARAAARGEVGTLRLAYTLSTVYETLPALIDALAAEHPDLQVRPREVFAEDIERMLGEGRVDLALAPHVAPRPGLEQHPVRQEPFVAAVAESHPLAAEQHISLAALANETVELWPHTMAPGYYDAAVAACRDAGFEPRLDEQAAGSTVWGNIARGRGVGLVVGSLHFQLPRGLALVALAAPAPTLAIDLVWPADRTTPAVRGLIAVADRLAQTRGWLPVSSNR
jgi:DNA-binding transcriptional LysR family regulator